MFFFFFNDTATTEIYTLSLHDALPISGALAMRERGIKNSDVVIGITASGRTPFVLGALACAKSLGAKAILLTCNPTVVASVSLAAAGTAASTVDADLVISLAVGPAGLTGSTR